MSEKLSEQLSQHPPTDDRLSVTPALECGDVHFLAGFARQHRSTACIWPGQPAAPSPWAPCDDGCCLVLAARSTSADAVGQWLRFIVTEFLGDRHRLDGWVVVRSAPWAPDAAVLIVEGGDVFEGVAS